MADVGIDLPVRPAAQRRARPFVVVIAVFVASVGLIVPWVGRWISGRAPFQPAAMNLSLNVSVVPVSQLPEVIAGYGVTEDQLRAMQPLTEGQEAVVGQLMFSLPKKMPDGSQLALFVVDERSHRLAQWAWGWSEGPHPPASGFAGSFSGFAARYPWLSATAPVFQGGAFTEPGAAITIPPGAQGPVTFYAALDPNALPVSDLSQDVSVTLGFVGPNGEIYWAHRLVATDSGQ